jgi:hypothetical protein
MLWRPKAPADTVAYSVPWAIADDTIASFALTVVAGTVTIAASSHDDTNVYATIAGGADGETASFACQIVTMGGQTLSRPVTLFVSSVALFTPSTSIKRQIIEMAYEEIGLPGYTWDHSPEEIASGLRQLDALMLEWQANSIDLGYNQPAAFGQGDPDDASMIPDFAIQCAVGYLAFRLSPKQGKTAMSQSLGALAISMRAIRAKTAVVPQMAYPSTTPRGSGNKWYSNFWPYFAATQ